MSRYSRIAGALAASLYFWYCAGTRESWHFIDAANLIFHEAGHTIFFFLGEFVKIAAGSGFQVALPLAIALYFFAKGQKLSGSVCLLWVGQNLANVSVYAGDAVRMQLDLLGGDSVMHDWNYILGSLGLLNHTDAIASGIYALGLGALAIGTALSIYFAWPASDADDHSDIAAPSVPSH